MPLLRRPHDHRRDLRARRRTPRPAITRCLGQNCDAMTTVTARSHPLPAGNACFRPRSVVVPTLPNADCILPSMPKSPRRRPRRQKGLDRDRRSAADLAGQHYPRRDGRPSNPHRRQATRQRPRAPSLKAFGHRPAAPADRSLMGRYPKPCTNPVGGRNSRDGCSGARIGHSLIKYVPKSIARRLPRSTRASCRRRKDQARSNSRSGCKTGR